MNASSIAKVATRHLRRADINPYDDRVIDAKKALQECINDIYTLSHESGLSGKQRQAIKRALNRLIEATVEVDQLVWAFGKK